MSPYGESNAGQVEPLSTTSASFAPFTFNFTVDFGNVIMMSIAFVVLVYSSFRSLQSHQSSQNSYDSLEKSLIDEHEIDLIDDSTRDEDEEFVQLSVVQSICIPFVASPTLFAIFALFDRFQILFVVFTASNLFLSLFPTIYTFELPLTIT